MKKIAVRRPIKTKSRQYAAQVFFDVNMSCQQFGLTRYAKRLGYDVEALDRGQWFIFLNEALNKIKMLGPNNVLCYYRVRAYETLTLEDFEVIHQSFNSAFFIPTSILRELAKLMDSTRARRQEAA